LPSKSATSSELRILICEADSRRDGGRNQPLDTAGVLVRRTSGGAPNGVTEEQAVLRR
jgi:hypothetical protein